VTTVATLYCENDDMVNNGLRHCDRKGKLYRVEFCGEFFADIVLCPRHAQETADAPGYVISLAAEKATA
jgi:hypothetical protein